MTKHKKSKLSRSAKNSSNFHTSKYRSAFCHPNTFVKKLILAIIFMIMIIVIIAVLCSIFLNNENLVKSKISQLTTDYYENYFYPNLTSSEKFQNLKDVDSAMEKYHTRGLAPITLSDLLLYDDQKNAQYTDFLTKYCDQDATSIKIYPDPPYNQTSYHIDYTYSCNF